MTDSIAYLETLGQSTILSIIFVLSDPELVKFDYIYFRSILDIKYLYRLFV